MLTRLVARDFRNFEQLDVAIPPNGLVIVGENGHGKTNLLEAAAYLALLRSMRGARDVDMIRFGAPALHVRAELSSSSVVQQVSVGYERATKRKKATLDGVEQARLTAALGAVPSVGFSPADVALVAGNPGDRRRYLDVALALSSPTYLAALQQFRGALVRRNAVLRLVHRDASLSRSSAHAEQVSLWEPVLAEQGATVTAMRVLFVAGHAERFAQLARAIGERQPVTMRYATTSLSADRGERASDHEQSLAYLQSHYAALYTQVFTQQRSNELRRGVTLIGPHRDELGLALGGRELRTFGSAGQQRSAAIALRLLELATLRASLGRTPLLLLDDPFAELDLGRASRVLALLGDAGVEQVLLAVPRVEDIPSAFTRLARATMHEGVLT
jgi:DNA replication and repair protein RecF